MAEANAGTCDRIQELTRQFLAYANNKAIGRPQRDVLVGNLVYAMEAQNNCPFDRRSLTGGQPLAPAPVAPAPAATAIAPPIPGTNGGS